MARNALNALMKWIGLASMTACAAMLGGCGGQGAAPEAAPKGYAYWPGPPSEPRIQFLKSYQRASDLKTAQAGKFEDLFYGKAEQADLPIVKPYGAAIWNGRIYVTDLRGKGIVVMDLRKRETRVMGATGSGEIKKAVDICIAPDGMKYVADTERKAVMIFDANDRFVKSFTAADFFPVGLAVYGNELFVSDYQARMVKVLDRNTGNLLRRIGEEGGEDGQFVRPLDVAVDKEGNLYVSDVMRCRIQKFNRKGEVVLGFGQAGARPGDFVRPKHMAVTDDGLIMVVDASFNNVQVFDEEGKIMGYFGGNGRFPGAMNLPAGLAVTTSDLDIFAPYISPDFQAEQIIVVTNNFGANKVSVYAMGKLKPGRKPVDISPTRIEIKEEEVDPKRPAVPLTPEGLPTDADTRPATRPAK